jgi:hypothetical protein
MITIQVRQPRRTEAYHPQIPLTQHGGTGYFTNTYEQMTKPVPRMQEICGKSLNLECLGKIDFPVQYTVLCVARLQDGLTTFLQCSAQ